MLSDQDNFVLLFRLSEIREEVENMDDFGDYDIQKIKSRFVQMIKNYQEVIHGLHKEEVKV